jgi:hypothetical protein
MGAARRRAKGLIAITAKSATALYPFDFLLIRPQRHVSFSRVTAHLRKLIFMKAVLALLITLSAPAAAKVQEDAAHRADRLRTQELNSRSANGYARPAAAAGNERSGDDYAQAQADYRRRLADWRRRVAACENGYYDACQQ